VRVRPPSRESEESARRPRSSPARHRRRLGGVLALLALAAAIVGLYAGSRQFYFLGTDDRGVVTLYRGLPYELPFGIDLYTEEFASDVPASAIKDPRQRKNLLDHRLRSRGEAVTRLRQLERAETPR
jgi:protein phosphatase